jgi:hypothetical protein
MLDLQAASMKFPEATVKNRINTDDSTFSEKTSKIIPLSQKKQYNQNENKEERRSRE